MGGEVCPTCDGTKFVEIPTYNVSSFEPPRSQRCFQCRGTGFVVVREIKETKPDDKKISP